MDGSLSTDLPTQRLSELFNVNNFIVSQTNPWYSIISQLNSLNAFSKGYPVHGPQ